MEKYSLLTKLAKCTLNIALKLTFSVFLFFFVFWLHFRPPRHCLRPFSERQFFTQMTVERREEKVGKPLLTGSALGGDKFRNICDMETIPPETDVLINNAHFPSFISPKFPFRRSWIANEVGNTRLRWGESRVACSKRSDSGERCGVKKAMKSRGGLGRAPFYFAPLPTIWTPGTG